MLQRIGAMVVFCTVIKAVFVSSELLAHSLDTKVTQQAGWAAAFVSKKTKDDCFVDNSLTMPGFELLTGGGIMGIEWQLCPLAHKGQIGIAVRYDNSDLDGNDNNCHEPHFHGTDLDFDSMRAIIYSRWLFNNPLYLTGMLSYAFNQYFIYQNLGGHPHSKRFGEYDGYQWTAQFELGYDWKGTACNIEVTPELFVFYSRLNTQAYKQVIADGLNNQTINCIDSQSDNALFLGGDLRLAYVNIYPKAKVIPYIHANISYQTLTDSRQDFTATNALGGGTAFIYLDDRPARNYYQVGGGIKVLGDHDVVIVMSYDYSFQPGEHMHAVLLSIKHDW